MKKGLLFAYEQRTASGALCGCGKQVSDGVVAMQPQDVKWSVLHETDYVEVAQCEGRPSMWIDLGAIQEDTAVALENFGSPTNRLPVTTIHRTHAGSRGEDRGEINPGRCSDSTVKRRVVIDGPRGEHAYSDRSWRMR